MQNLVTPPFRSVNTLCGDIEFTAELVYNATLPTASDPIALNATQGVVKFNTNGNFIVESADTSLYGAHELLISGSLIEYPAQVTGSKTSIPISFEPCEVKILDSWSL